jgi:hypothetical protein
LFNYLANIFLTYRGVPKFEGILKDVCHPRLKCVYLELILYFVIINMSQEQDNDNDSFPEETQLDEKTAAGSLDNSDQEDDSEVSEGEDNNLYDLMADFFINENGDNVATVLTNIQNSIDQNSKCLLKLTKVLQEFVGAYSEKNKK